MFLKIKNEFGAEERVSTKNIVSYYLEEVTGIVWINLSNGKKILTNKHTVEELDLALNECFLFVKDVPKNSK